MLAKALPFSRRTFNAPLHAKPKCDPHHPINRGIIICSLFNECGGNILYNATDVNFRRGTITPTSGQYPSWQDTKYGGALKFDSYGYVDFNAAAVGWSSTCGISVWAMPMSTSPNRLVTKHGASGSYGILVSGYTGEKIEFRLSTDGTNWYGGVTSDSCFTAEKLHHVVCNFVGSQYMYTWVDGSLRYSYTLPTPGTIYNSTATLQYGRDHLAGDSRIYIGYLFQVRLYRRPLLQSEILALYHNPMLGIVMPNQRQSWYLPEATGDLLPFFQNYYKKLSGRR